MVPFGFFTGKELAAAKAFKVSSIVYGANRADANGQSTLISGKSGS